MVTVGPAERLELLAALMRRFNHEFRTPLNTIVGWGHLLQQGSVDPERSAHAASVIARNARQQSAMLEGFVEDGRIIVEQVSLQPERVRFDELMRQIDRSMVTSRTDLRVHIDAGDVSVVTDRRLLQRLLERLLAVVAGRTQLGQAIDLSASGEAGALSLTLVTAAVADDWTENDQLELRIGTLTAAALGGTLRLSAQAEAAAIRVWLPDFVRTN